MSTEKARDFLERTQQNRGYTLEMHRIMAEADLEWAEKYHQFIEATYTGQRLLDRKTKELLQIVVEAALRADVEQGLRRLIAVIEPVLIVLTGILVASIILTLLSAIASVHALVF